MRSFVVLTYYHLMHAVAMTLDSGGKSNLYFIRGFYGVSDETIQKIEAAGVFENVVSIDQKEYSKQLVNRLAAVKNLTEAEIDAIGSTIFDETLEPYFERVFKTADKDDEIYVYNDLQRPYYYIARHFSRIIGVEDGYCGLSNWLKAQSFSKLYEPINRFTGKYYPEVHFKNDNIIRIISSCKCEDVPKHIQNKLEVLDFKEIVRRNQEAFRTAMLRIFPVGDVCIDQADTLYLTAPMSRSGYCNALEDYLVSRKIVREELVKGRKVLVKPHPAESTIDYGLMESDDVHVLSRDFPVELLEFVVPQKIDKVKSFFSSAITADFCLHEEKKFTEDAEPEKIKRAIKEYVAEESLTVNIYITVEDCSLYRYVNILSWLESFGYFRKNVKLLVPAEKEQEFRDYYTAENFKINVRDYLAQEENAPYFRELDKLSGIELPDEGTSFSIHGTESFDEKSIFNDYVRGDDFDYFIILDSYNQGMVTFRKIRSNLKKTIVWGYSPMNYTYLNDRERTIKTFIGGCRTKGTIEPQLTNLLLHRNFVTQIEKAGGYSRENVTAVLNKKATCIEYKEGVHLHIPNGRYLAADNGEEYYAKTIQKILMERRGEETAGRIAEAVYEYRNWRIINPKGIRSKEVSRFINELAIDIDLKMQVYSKLTDILLLEKEKVESKKAYRENEWCDYIMSIISKSNTRELLKQKKNKRSAKKLIKKGLRKIKR